MTVANDFAYHKGNYCEMSTSVIGSDEGTLDTRIGTANDARDMDRLGKKQELRVRLNLCDFEPLSLHFSVF